MLYVESIRTLLRQTDWLTQHPFLRRKAAEFVRLGEQQLNADQPALRIFQREYAVAYLNEKPGLIVGSDQATTCLMVLLICASANKAVFAHLDQASEEANDLDLLLKDMQRPKAYLVGSYCDSRLAGKRLCNLVLRQLQESLLPIDLVLFCVGSLNTAPDGWPFATKLAYNTATGEVLKAKFLDRGPARYLRWDPSVCERKSVYNPDRGVVQISRAEVRLAQPAIDLITEVLKMDNQEFLEHTSTSPLHEGPEFVAEAREAYQWQLENQGNTFEATCYAWNYADGRWRECKKIMDAD